MKEIEEFFGVPLMQDARQVHTYQLRERLPMDTEIANSLREAFGYVPDERGGEQWCVYQDHTLIVIHPERRPRLYKRGCGGVYYEIEPDFR